MFLNNIIYGINIKWIQMIVIKELVILLITWKN